MNSKKLDNIQDLEAMYIPLISLNLFKIAHPLTAQQEMSLVFYFEKPIFYWSRY